MYLITLYVTTNYHLFNPAFVIPQIPKVYWDFSSPRVLTMEYCQGLEIGEIAQDKETKLQSYRKDISKKVTRLYSEMIFLHGFIHCDPHPGNLKIDLDSNGKPIIHLLDHGLYSVISLLL